MAPRRRVRLSHQRASCGHGPAHTTTSPPPPGNASHSRRAGSPLASPRPSTARRCPSEPSNTATASTTRAGAGPGTPPGHGAPVRSGARRCQRAQRLGLARIASAHPAHAFVGESAALHHRGDHGVGTEHALYPCEHSCGTFGGRRVTTPEPELTTVCDHDFVGDEAQHREPAGDDTRVGEIGVARATVARQQPRVELPAHTFGQRARCERFARAPRTREHVAVIGGGLDRDAHARESVVGQPFEESVGQGLGRERGHVDAATPADRTRGLSTRSGGTRPSRPSVESRPRARRCACAPTSPNRASTVSAGSAAKAPRLVRPSRCNRSVTAGTPSAATGHGARNVAVSPDATMCASSGNAERVATHAANTPSAMPTRTSVTPAARTTAITCRGEAIVATVIARRTARREREPTRLHQFEPRRQ